MEYPSVEVLMKQIRDWAEEEDYDAIIEVLPENSRAILRGGIMRGLCLFESGILP